MKSKEIVGLVKQAGAEWVEDKVPRLGAALAYYTIFAIAPVLILAIAIAGLVFGRDAVQGQVLEQVRGLVGEEGGKAIESMLISAAQSGHAATGIGLVLLLVSAVAMFGQLQDALNTIWGVSPKPGRGILGVVKDRLVSLAMVMGTAFLLLASLVLSTGLAAASSQMGSWRVGIIGGVLDIVISVAVFTPLFAMIYRYLPDAEISWKDVWFGAGVTAVLFVVGKIAIGLYIGHSNVGSIFGAAGSLVVLLVWAYYAAQIFLFGAELTKVYANRYGSRIVPEAGAEAVVDGKRAEEGMPAGTGKARAALRRQKRRG